MGLAENWLILALASPVFWAAICLIDCCFVGKGLYRSALDGPVLAGIFSAIPLVLLTLTGATTETQSISSAHALISYNTYPASEVHGAILISALAALFYSAHIFFYFRTLFRLNDSANTESILALSVAIVPVLAWFLLGERLTPLFYLSVGLTVVGLIIASRSTIHRMFQDKSVELIVNENVNIGTTTRISNWLPRSFNQQCARYGVVADLTAAVFCFSAYMVLQAKALEDLSFTDATISFNATMLLLSLLALGCSAPYRRRIFRLLFRYFSIFLCAEGLEIAARLAAQRATEIGPSVTAVTLVQCLLPPLIIIICLVLMGADRVRRYLSPTIRLTLSLQCQGLASKTTLLILTMMALLVFQQDSLRH